MARAGAKVALLDQRREWAQATNDMITEEGGTSIAVQADVSEQASCSAAVDEVVAAFGGQGTRNRNGGERLGCYGLTSPQPADRHPSVCNT